MLRTVNTTSLVAVGRDVICMMCAIAVTIIRKETMGDFSAGEIWWFCGSAVEECLDSTY